MNIFTNWKLAFNMKVCINTIYFVSKINNSSVVAEQWIQNSQILNIGPKNCAAISILV